VADRPPAVDGLSAAHGLVFFREGGSAVSRTENAPAPRAWRHDRPAAPRPGVARTQPRCAQPVPPPDTPEPEPQPEPWDPPGDPFPGPGEPLPPGPMAAEEVG
jgi:hypothetical protein